MQSFLVCWSSFIGETRGVGFKQLDCKIDQPMSFRTFRLEFRIARFPSIFRVKFQTSEHARAPPHAHNDEMFFLGGGFQSLVGAEIVRGENIYARAGGNAY